MKTSNQTKKQFFYHKNKRYEKFTVFVSKTEERIYFIYQLCRPDRIIYFFEKENGQGLSMPKATFERYIEDDYWRIEPHHNEKDKQYIQRKLDLEKEHERACQQWERKKKTDDMKMFLFIVTFLFIFPICMPLAIFIMICLFASTDTKKTKW